METKHLHASPNEMEALNAFVQLFARDHLTNEWLPDAVIDARPGVEKAKKRVRRLLKAGHPVLADLPQDTREWLTRFGSSA